MTLFTKTSSKFFFLSRPLRLPSTIRTHWTYQYKPGPYPRTPEERKKAAEKYNLHPDEYEPYPDDGTGLGDYPKLPDIGYASRDPYYPWDFPELKRNFNEPFHAEFGYIREDRYNPTQMLRHPMWILWLQFLALLVAYGAPMWVFEQIKMFPPLVPRQYPEEGKKHYTFEKATEDEPQSKE